MSKNLREWWSTRWWFFVAALALVAVVLTATQWNSRHLSSLAVGGACTTSQLRLDVGATHHVEGTTVQRAQLTLTNTGRACALVGDAPLIQPVKGAHHSPVGVGNIPDGLARAALVLGPGESAYSAISVTALPPPFSRACHPETATGLVITDGEPRQSSRYVAHDFLRVCSNRARDNIGAGSYVAAP